MIEKITGSSFVDERGKVFFSNNLNLSDVKRMYVIENADNTIVRAWQAHKVESRWFVALRGSFHIKLMEIDDFDHPSDNLVSKSYFLKADSLESMVVKPGHASSIQSMEDHSQLLVFSDYQINEIEDNYKYDANKWK